MTQASAPFSGPGPPRGPRLTGRFADGSLGEFPLGPTTTLGRHPSNTLRLVDREVSKEHAIIERMGRDFILGIWARPTARSSTGGAWRS